MLGDNSTARSVDVLIAEDDSLVRDCLRQLLEREGYTIAEAADGIEAVDLARRHRPRCVFLDLAMPGKDGFTVARELRLDPRTRSAHIHCVTGRLDSDAREQAQQAGCEMYFTKPVNPAELLGLVQEQVRPMDTEWITGLGLAEAQQLMDWLENNGCAGLELDLRDDDRFAVRCSSPPAGLRLGRDEQGRVRLLHT
jgi:chemosensory pili system protein ChpA (sensor histidine kinase/response regulator)